MTICFYIVVINDMVIVFFIVINPSLSIINHILFLKSVYINVFLELRLYKFRVTLSCYSLSRSLPHSLRMV